MVNVKFIEQYVSRQSKWHNVIGSPFQGNILKRKAQLAIKTREPVRRPKK
jgi:hypothetical protein